MKKDLVEILACPMCKSELALSIESESNDEVSSGNLTCSKCGHVYPIEDGIPNLLPPEYEVTASSE